MDVFLKQGKPEMYDDFGKSGREGKIIGWRLMLLWNKIIWFLVEYWPCEPAPGGHEGQVDPEQFEQLVPETADR